MIRINSQTSFVPYPNNIVMEKRLLDSKLYSASYETEYIPFYSMFIGVFKRIGDFRYNIYWISDTAYTSCRTINQAVTYLGLAVQPVSFVRAGVTYYILKNLIYVLDENENPIILFSLIVHRDYWRNINQSFTNLDYSKFLIIINTDFEDEKYKSMYVYFKRYILEDTYKLIDIVLTNNIKRYCFKEIEESPLQFTTIVQMKEYLSSLTKIAIDELIK